MTENDRNTESLGETKLRMIREDLVILDNRAKRILEERAQLILKLAKTREALAKENE
tara:strand:+ start:142 stop:312 length:171 start_codon:yes stop_codon:yes gene_type:complete